MDIQKEREEIIKEIEKLDDIFTEEVINKFSKEELMQYLNLINKIETKLKLL